MKTYRCSCGEVNVVEDKYYFNDVELEQKETKQILDNYSGENDVEVCV